MKINKMLVVNIVFAIIMMGGILYLTENTKYQDFPKGCFQGYTQNMTPSGFISSDSEYCYAKIYDGWDSECTFLFIKGCNSYKHISWERVK